MHAFAIDLTLDSSESIKDDTTFSTINNKYESSEEETCTKETKSKVTHSCKESFHIS